jgi:hypothetical protein
VDPGSGERGRGARAAEKTFVLRPGWHRYQISGVVRSAGREAIDAFIIIIATRSVAAGGAFYVDDVRLEVTNPRRSSL